MIPEVGIYRDVPFRDYCEWEAVNSSSLGPMAISPAHYKHQLATPREDTDAFRLGRFIHSAKLEPSSLLNDYAVVPDNLYDDVVCADGSKPSNPKSTKQGKEKHAAWVKSIGERQIVDPTWLTQMQDMLAAINCNPRASMWLNHNGPAEVSYVWDDPDTGIRCKARCDKLDPGARIITDIKTTASVEDFTTSIGKFAYHRQAAFYCRGMDLLDPKPGEWFKFVFVAVSKVQPYLCHAAPLDDDSLSGGRQLVSEALQRIAECRTSNDWPGPPEPKSWRAPAWSMPEVTLTINGKEVTL